VGLPLQEDVETTFGVEQQPSPALLFEVPAVVLFRCRSAPFEASLMSERNPRRDFPGTGDILTGHR